MSIVAAVDVNAPLYNLMKEKSGGLNIFGVIQSATGQSTTIASSIVEYISMADLKVWFGGVDLASVYEVAKARLKRDKIQLKSEVMEARLVFLLQTKEILLLDAFFKKYALDSAEMVEPTIFVHEEIPVQSAKSKFVRKEKNLTVNISLARSSSGSRADTVSKGSGDEHSQKQKQFSKHRTESHEVNPAPTPTNRTLGFKRAAIPLLALTDKV